MTKSFQVLRNALSVEAKKLAQEKTQHLLKNMALQELRQAMLFSQERLAELLVTKQANFHVLSAVRICMFPHYVVISKQWAVSWILWLFSPKGKCISINFPAS